MVKHKLSPLEEELSDVVNGKIELIHDAKLETIKAQLKKLDRYNDEANQYTVNMKITKNGKYLLREEVLSTINKDSEIVICVCDACNSEYQLKPEDIIRYAGKHDNCEIDEPHTHSRQPFELCYKCQKGRTKGKVKS